MSQTPDKELLISDYLALCAREQAALADSVPFADYERAADARLAGYWRCIAAGWAHEEIAAMRRQQQQQQQVSDA